MHAGRGGVINLDAAHGGVALPAFGIAGNDARQRDEAASILLGPALQDAKMQKI